jgi:formate hydrogenlyase subunit 6/NADH:ubiquinone oxidoreductase subunit I
MKWTLVDSSGLEDVLVALAEGRDVFALKSLDNGSYSLTQTSAWDSERHTLGAFRQTEPLKALFFPAREFIGRWPGSPAADSLAVPMPEPTPQPTTESTTESALDLAPSLQPVTPPVTADRSTPGPISGRTSKPMRERIVFGVKNCDLSSLGVFDFVFLHGVCEDPYYAEAREKTILVSTDCSGQLDVCFCPAVGEQPFAEEGFDINIASTPDGYVIEAGTARGGHLLKSVEHLLEPASLNLLEVLAQQRLRRYRELVAHSEAHGLEPGNDLRAAVEGSFESGLWQDFAEDCVECGACNFICCTCHCFLLADGEDEHGVPARSKLWDACLYSAFARTAGGGNPRPLRAERLRNRFDKKFSFFPQVLGRYACDGCGRCTEACIAQIDIRDVLRRAVDESDAIHAHSRND